MRTFEVKQLHYDLTPVAGLALVRVGESLLMARLTRRSADRLQLQPGLPVWVQVKSVALLS